jgi:hypothetical protein
MRKIHLWRRKRAVQEYLLQSLGFLMTNCGVYLLAVKGGKKR